MAIARRWQTAAGLASGRGGAVAPGTLDPIDAAQNDIAGSKDLIASISDDLSQHYRWLESNRSAEIKHRRRLKRQAVMYQVELHSRRLAAIVRRVALFSWRWTRTIALFLWVPTKAVFLALNRLASQALAWLSPYAQTAVTVVAIAFVWLALEFHALMLALRRWSARTTSRLRVKGGALARDTAKASAITSTWLYVNLRILAQQSRRWYEAGWAWARVHGGRLARAAAEAASSAFTWITMNGRTLAFDLRSQFSAATAKLDTNVPAFSRAAVAMASAVAAQAAMKSRELSRSWNGRATSAEAGPVNYQALAPRPSTALALVEPTRPALPVVQQAIQRQQPARPKKAKKAKKTKRRVNSRADRASP